jgi:uncharacterized protein
MKAWGSVYSLHVYPLKGARGIALSEANILATGLAHDRRFLVVEASGAAVTQRNHPRMARVVTAIDEGSLVLTCDGDRLAVPLTPAGPRRRVRIWDDDVDAIVVPDAASFFTRYLGVEASLVYVPDDAFRVVEPAYAEPGDRVGFADAYPILVAGLASLDDLNARLDVPVPMDRFRPNVVIEGAAPFAEEAEAALLVGELRIRTPKRCSRCQVVTVDQTTGAAGKEPLRTLAKYRASENKVFFGMNAIPDLAPGASYRLAVGAPVFSGRQALDDLA